MDFVSLTHAKSWIRAAIAGAAALSAIVVVALIIIGIVLMIARKREGARLKDHFGPEYERQVREAGGSRAKAEAELLKRDQAAAGAALRGSVERECHPPPSSR